MKRLLLLIVLALALASPVSADTIGSARQARANVRCAVAGRTMERRGLSDRERVLLVRIACKREPNGTWDSALVFTQ